MADLLDLVRELDTAVLAVADAGGLRRHLVDMLESTGWRLRELDTELTRTHFTHRSASQWPGVGSWQP